MLDKWQLMIAPIKFNYIFFQNEVHDTTKLQLLPNKEYSFQHSGKYKRQDFKETINVMMKQSLGTLSFHKNCHQTQEKLHKFLLISYHITIR